MNTLLLLFLAILPNFLILWYFYKKDKYKPESKAVLAKLFILSALITIPLAIIFQIIIDSFTETAGIIGIFISAFISAALVEESLKYFMVKQFAFHKPYFDEVIDGIMYAVTASLGFATLENIMYVMFSETGALGTAIFRSFTAVPGHALDGAILGYFLGLAKFAKSKDHQWSLIKKGLLFAIIFHGLYDFFIFTGILAPLIFPLLIVQGRFVYNAIQECHKKNPKEKLYFGWKPLTQGLSVWDYIKLIFGTLVGSIFILFLIGISIDFQSALQEFTLEGFIFTIILLFSLTFFPLYSVWRKKKSLMKKGIRS